MSDYFTYTGARQRTIAFPIGGIGTGCFSINGYGGLVDWEIFHRPNKLSILPHTFFSIWTQTESGMTDARVLESWSNDLPLIGEVGGRKFDGFGFGARREAGAGLRHMQKSAFRGEYPFAWVDFEDPTLPVKASLMTYNPFIPLNVEDSGLPTGIFEVTITNTSNEPVAVSVAANLFNPVGYQGHGPFKQVIHGEFKGTGNRNFNRFVRDGDLVAVLMSSEHYTNDVPYGGSMALATTWPDITYQTCWLRGAWFDSLQMFWDEFSATGRLLDRTYPEPTELNHSDTGSLALHARLAPGETVVMPLFITWYFPNFIKYWGDSYSPANELVTWRVPYAHRF